MSQSILLRSIPRTWDAAISFVTEALEGAGFQVVQSFDLQLARETHVICNCPHHGTNQCNCQYAVFLLYQENSYPITLVCHGRDAKTKIYLIQTPDQQTSKELIRLLHDTLGSSLSEVIRQAHTV